MAKNAYVTRLHTNGTETHVEGDVIENVSNERFNELEKNGLVREATTAEVTAARKQAQEPANKAAPATQTK